MCAGVAESVTVLTPGENLKTKLIDSRGAGTSLTTRHIIAGIFATDGIAGFYRGVVPVAIKQSSNAVIRFTSYQLLLEKVTDILQKQNRQSTVIAPAVAGGLAGIITVYATMPFDNIKTKLQAIGGAREYAGTIDCLRAIIRTEGIRGLWRGTTPRLVRLSVSGVISFSIYEQVIAMTRAQKSEQKLGGASVLT